ncbi:MAG: hypothetical protein JWQ97_3387 [Phenylobacterium sp.]|nr:hypothetical protein [Phenylobacterium sp.]
MTTYSVSGKGHHMLAHAELGGAPVADLIYAAVGDASRQHKSKAWRTLDALKRDGLVELQDGSYRLTLDGQDALVCLRSGHPAVIASAVPSVRIFGRAA